MGHLSPKVGPKQSPGRCFVFNQLVSVVPDKLLHCVEDAHRTVGPTTHYFPNLFQRFPGRAYAKLVLRVKQLFSLQGAWVHALRGSLGTLIEVQGGTGFIPTRRSETPNYPPRSYLPRSFPNVPNNKDAVLTAKQKYNDIFFEHLEEVTLSPWNWKRSITQHTEKHLASLLLPATEVTRLLTTVTSQPQDTNKRNSSHIPPTKQTRSTPGATSRQTQKRRNTTGYQTPPKKLKPNPSAVEAGGWGGVVGGVGMNDYLAYMHAVRTSVYGCGGYKAAGAGYYFRRLGPL